MQHNNISTPTINPRKKNRVEQSTSGYLLNHTNTTRTASELLIFTDHLVLTTYNHYILTGLI